VDKMKVSKEKQKVQVGISFSHELLEEIDKLRGREPRSFFVCRMLENYFLAKAWIVYDAEKSEARVRLTKNV